ncbi:MAG: DNA repair protein RadA [Treponemataceae bacterium]
MAKKTIVFRCSACGYTQPKWLGRCPNCGAWNTFEETADEAVPLKSPFRVSNGKAETNVPLSKVRSQDAERFETGLSEFDRVLGGGAMKRSAILIGGEPGIGKSTLLLQVAAHCGKKVLYVSGEESAGQIKGRVDRLNLKVDNVEVLCTGNVKTIEAVLNKLNPLFVIIDSVQTLYHEDAGLIPGTINQLKYGAFELISWVKERDAVLFFTAHVTKEGSIAGPKVLEHLVDTVISFERNDEDLRFLRAHKNRFGSVDELGIFEMCETGLLPIDNTASLFLTSKAAALPVGAAIVPVFEGSRVFLVEVQALTVPAKSSLSRVFSDRVEPARVSRIAAVLEKRIGLTFSDQDIYINVAGGIRLRESASDLALAVALYSARTDLLPNERACYVGEISLAGEIRPVKKASMRLKMAATLGLPKIYVPESRDAELEQADKAAITPVTVTNLKEVIAKAFGTKTSD